MKKNIAIIKIIQQMGMKFHLSFHSVYIFHVYEGAASFHQRGNFSSSP